MPVFVYAAKFLCGSFDLRLISEREHLEGPVKPGNYATAINMQLLKGAAPSAPVFIKGWVILSAPAPLDVVAVYTSHTYDREGQPEGFGLEIDRVTPTQVTRLATPRRSASTKARRR